MSVYSLGGIRMAINYPGPYEVRIFYNSTVSSVLVNHEHRFTLELDAVGGPGDDFDQFTVYPKDESHSSSEADELDTVVDEYAALMQPYFEDGGVVAITHAELWQYVPETFEASYMSSYDLSLNGTHTGAIVAASQIIQTYRTQEGGIMKQSFQECSIAAGPRNSLAVITGFIGAMRDYVLAADTYILARDTSYPIAPLSYLPGQSEAIFKRRYRDT
jgi:hypothetical protein